MRSGSTSISRGRSGSRSISRGRSRGRDANIMSSHRASSRHNSRYVYDIDDDDNNSRRFSVSSNLAEDGDHASISSDFSLGGFACGACDPVCCGGQEDDFTKNEAELEELHELRKEINEMKQMIEPSAVSVVEHPGPRAPPSPSFSRKGSSSPRMQAHGLQIDMKRTKSRPGKLIALSENDLVQVDTRDEEEKDRRERYYTSLGRQGNHYGNEDDDYFTRFLQCSNFCISWNNCERGQDHPDDVSDITSPTEVPWNNTVEMPWRDDYQPINTIRTSPTLRTESSLALSRNIKQRSSFAGPSVAPSKRTHHSKTPSNGTPTSNSKSNASPRSVLHNFSSPLRRRPSFKVDKVKARKIMDEDTGSVLFEV